MARVAEQIQDRKFWRAVAAEFFATFLFVFLGVGSALTTLGIAPGSNADALYNATLSIALCFGLSIFVLAHIFGSISGGHINPAVTFGLLLAQKVGPLRALLYVIAQIIGAIVASVVLMAIMGLNADTMGGYNALSGPDDSRIARGFVTEMVLTMILMLTVFATIDPKAAGGSPGTLAIGMAVGVAHLVAVPITGCGINPARSIGPAVLTKQRAAQDDLWVFIIAPLVGAALGALIYNVVLTDACDAKLQAMTPKSAPRQANPTAPETIPDVVADELEAGGKDAAPLRL